MKRTEDTQLLAKLMMKYAPMLTGKAMKELLEIDFIKNNFSIFIIANHLPSTYFKHGVRVTQRIASFM